MMYVITAGDFVPIELLYVLGAANLIVLFLFLFLRDRKGFFKVSCRLSTAFLMTVAIGIGGYVPNYLLYIFPIFIASYFSFFEGKWKMQKLLVMIGLFSTAVLLYATPDSPYSQSIGLYETMVKSSAQLDRVMDSCHLDRYITKVPFPVFALSHHFPIGPIFTPYFHDYLGFNHPFYVATFENMKNADLLIEPVKLFNGNANAFPADIMSEFVEKDPPCASGGMEGYILKFKK